jgi:pyridoxamine 5'-phosphate oxidase family protein
MRAFVLIIALALAAVVVYSAYVVATAMRENDTRRLRKQATWRVRHHTDNDTTVVTVSLVTPRDDVLDEHVVARLPVDAPDWQERFGQAKQEAEERAFHLNT